MRDRDGYRRRTHPPILRLRGRLQLVRRGRHHVNNAVASLLQRSEILGSAATVRAWISCNSRMPLRLASIRLIAS